MAKFKVGDRFKVVSNVDDEHFDSFVGETGTIDYDGGVDKYGQVYWVLLDASDERGVLGDVYFFESELEKLED